MTFRDKVSYIVFNHIAALIFCGLVLVGSIGIGYRLLTRGPVCDLSVAFVNAYTDESDVDLSGELDNYFDLDGKDDYAYVDMGYQLSYATEDGEISVDNTAANNSLFEKYFLNIREHNMDVAIVPESFYDYCNSMEEIYYDVTYVLSAEQVEKYGEYLVEGSGETEGLQAGLRIDDCPYLKEHGISFIDVNSDESYILVFPVNSSNKENAARFVDYLWEK